MKTVTIIVGCSLSAVTGAVADDAAMSGGIMGNGTWFGAEAVWLPTLILLVVVAVMLSFALRARK